VENGAATIADEAKYGGHGARLGHYGRSIMLAGRDFARPEWDLEWLATLPFPLPTLLLCRLIERVFTSASGMLGLLPFLSVLAWTCGYRWAAPLLPIIGHTSTICSVLAT
jgi:hypothetical protein